jgi:hypothetical protein
VLALFGVVRLVGSFTSRIPAHAPQLTAVVNLPSRAMQAVVTEVRGAFGLSPSAVAEPEPPALSAAAEPVAPKPARPRAATVARADADPGTPPVAPRARRTTSNGARFDGDPTPGEASQPRLALTSGTPAAADDEVYDSADSDVTPPQPLGQFRVSAPSSVPIEEVVNIELVVNAQGTVDSVKAQTTPRTLGESLLLNLGLSAAKSWRFRPALKAGQPVAYRTFIAVRGS